MGKVGRKYRIGPVFDAKVGSENLKPIYRGKFFPKVGIWPYFGVSVFFHVFFGMVYAIF